MSKELPSFRIGQHESNYPIVQGGMSTGLSGAEMAAAVANNGGFGTIGGVGLGMSPEVRKQKDYFDKNESGLRREINDALEMSNNGNIGVNLMVATTDYENLVKTVVESKAKFIVSGAGLPLSLPKLVEKYKVSGQETPELIPIVSSVRALNIILRGWKGVLPAAVVVETPNTAGGHLGVTKVEDIGREEFGLDRVVPELKTYLKDNGFDIPIIAAGGIWSRTDIDHMLDMGASGVQMATRFLGTNECNASVKFKTRHITNTDKIIVISSPVGMPGRAIENDFIKKVGSGERFNLGTCVECLHGCGYRKSKFETGYCIIRALDNVRNGEVENGVLFTGTNGDRLKEDGIVSVGQIMSELTKM